MEFDQIVTARGGSLSVRNQRANFFPRIEATGGAYTRTVQGHGVVYGHQHAIVRHVLEHGSAPGPQSIQAFGGGRLIELYDHMGSGEPGQTATADDRIVGRNRIPGINWGMNLKA